MSHHYFRLYKQKMIVYIGGNFYILNIYFLNFNNVGIFFKFIFFRGAYPYNERRKLFEKARNKNKKHVTFEVNEIVEGSEVRTKSAPIYSAGCVAFNFTGGLPMVIIF